MDLREKTREVEIASGVSPTSKMYTRKVLTVNAAYMRTLGSGDGDFENPKKP